MAYIYKCYNISLAMIHDISSGHIGLHRTGEIYYIGTKFKTGQFGHCVGVLRGQVISLS